MTTPSDDTLNLRVLRSPEGSRRAQKTHAGPRVPQWAESPRETPQEGWTGWLADCCAVALGVFLGSVLAVGFCALAFTLWFG